jgi:hypothetical protein
MGGHSDIFTAIQYRSCSHQDLSCHGSEYKMPSCQDDSFESLVDRIRDEQNHTYDSLLKEVRGYHVQGNLMQTYGNQPSLSAIY